LSQKCDKQILAVFAYLKFEQFFAYRKNAISHWLISLLENTLPLVFLSFLMLFWTLWLISIYEISTFQLITKMR